VQKSVSIYKKIDDEIVQFRHQSLTVPHPGAETIPEMMCVHTREEYLFCESTGINRIFYTL